jgi:hypothetical protein
MKRLLLETLFIWAVLVAVMFGLAELARGDDSPPPITPTFRLMELSATCSVSAAAPITLSATFGPIAVVSVNGVTTTISTGNPVSVFWSAADTTSISVTDTDGATRWVTRAAVAAATVSIAGQVIAANPTGN